MKSVRCMLSFVVMLFSTLAVAQSAAPSAQKSDAQKSFDILKTLAGTWQGPVKADPPQRDWEAKPVHVSLRITSRGNALVHEMADPDHVNDPTHYDHPVTMLYLDNGKLTLTHYCDAGNRPRMVARTSPDGKKVEFDFVDLAGGNQYGHMYHAVFTIIDANHHIEDWTYMEPGDKPIRARLDLQRTNVGSGAAGK